MKSIMNKVSKIDTVKPGSRPGPNYSNFPRVLLPFLLLFSGVTILLSLTVFHNIVTETLPQVSDAMPLLGTCKENINFEALFRVSGKKEAK